MLLSINSDNERRLVHNLLTNSNVLLLNENTSVVNRGGHSHLENDGLESSLEEILNLQLQDVIELLSRFVQKTESGQSSQQGRTLNLSLLVIFWQSQENSSSLSHSGQNVLESPDFILVLQTVLTTDLQLSVNSLLFEGTSWGGGYLAVVSVVSHDSSLLWCVVYYDVNVFLFLFFVIFRKFAFFAVGQLESLNLQFFIRSHKARKMRRNKHNAMR